VKVELESQKKFHTIPINTEFIGIIQNKVSKSLFRHNRNIEIIYRGFQSENHEETRKTRNEGAKKTQNGAYSSK
jgi:hypothetical protein